MSATGLLSTPSSFQLPFFMALLAPSYVYEKAVILAYEGPLGRCHVIPGLVSLGSATCPPLQPCRLSLLLPPHLALSRLWTFHVPFLGLEYPLLFFSLANSYPREECRVLKFVRGWILFNTLQGKFGAFS